MRVFRHAVFVAFVLAVTAGAPCGGRGAENEAQSAAAKKLSLPRRPAWTTSRIHGSPEPPPPYRAERIYPSLKFEQPVEMVHEAELGGPVVVERRGKMFLLSGGVASDRRQLFFGGREDVDGLTAVYGLAFHPDFADNRLCYVCYILDAELPEGTRVSRFRVTEGDSPRIDPASETILLTWRSGGHNGGCLRFGPDGYLYISTGDASPPSGLRA